MARLMGFLCALSAAALCFCLTLGAAAALEVKYQGIDVTIDKRLTTDMILTFIFEETVSHFDYNLDSEILELESEVTTGEARCSFENTGSGGSIQCNLYGMEAGENTLKLRLKTNGAVKRKGDSYEFRSDFEINHPTKNLFAIVRMPETGMLASSTANQSYLPSDGTVMSDDGRRFMVSWRAHDMGRGDVATFSVRFELLGMGGTMQNISFAVLTVVAVAAMVGTAVYIRRGMKPHGEEQVKVLPLLNKSEKTVVDIVARYGGEARQKVLVKESDFSKAKVSRIMKSLVERGVIRMEPISGRENKVILKIKGVPVSRPKEEPEGD